MNTIIITGIVAAATIAIVIGLVIWKKKEKYIIPTYAPPPGPYKKTCRDIKMVGNTLQANCLNNMDLDTQGFVPSTLENANMCKNVVNYQYPNTPGYTGNLTCLPKWQ